MADVDSLQIQITAASEDAVKHIDSLINAIKRLQQAGSGLGSVSERIRNMGAAASLKGTGLKQGPTQGPTQVPMQSKTATTESEESLERKLSILERIKSTINSIREKRIKIESSDVEKASTKVSRLKTLLDSIRRITFYRAIRTFLKSITDGFKTGINNLYQYSALMNTEFKPSMDQIATSALYLKNSLGALSGPIIQAIAPAIDFLTDKFVDLLNSFNQLVASLSGAKTYTKAIKYQTEFAESADKAAKSAKSLMLGIDELNVLDTKSFGYGAGEDLDYEKMFMKDVPIETPWDNVAGILNDILPVVEAIGVALGSWKLGKFLNDANKLAKVLATAATIAIEFKVSQWSMTDFLNSKEIGSELQSIAKNALVQAASGFLMFKMWGPAGLILSATVGLVANLSAIHFETMKGNISASDPKTWISAALSAALATAGGTLALIKIGLFAGSAFGISAAVSVALTLAAINFSQIASGNWKVGGIQSVLTTLGSIAASGLGGWILSSAVFGAAAGPVGLAVGLGVGVLLNIVALSWANKIAYENSDFHKQMEAIREKASETMEVSKQINVNIETRYKNLEEVSANYKAMRTILDDMFALSDKPAKTAEEIDILKGYIEIVNSWKLDGITAQWDELNQAVIADRDAINDVIKAMEKQALMAAAQDMMTDSYKDLITAAKQLTIANEASAEAEAELKKLYEEKSAIMEKYGFLSRQAGESDTAYANRMRGSGAAATEFSSAMNEVNRKIADAQSAFDLAKSSVVQMQKTIQDVRTQIQDFAKIISDASGVGESAFEGLETSADSLYQYIDGAGWPELGKNIPTGLSDGITNGTPQVISAVKNMNNSFMKEVKDGQEKYISSSRETFKKVAEAAKSNSINMTIETKTNQLRKLNTIKPAQYASGGFPARGEMFIARERGPELVGKIGQKTTVANNEQIVSGIASGVADANTDVVNAVYAIGSMIVKAVEDNNTEISLDGETLTRKMQPYQNRLATMQGASLVD